MNDSKDFDELKKELEEKGLIGYEKDPSSFLLAISWVAVMVLVIVLTLKRNGII